MENYVLGSGNVFKELGFANADEKLAKVKLASIINKIIRRRGLSREESAEILGIPPHEASALRNGRLREFSMERLFSFLDSLDQGIDITISLKPTPTTKHGIDVARI